MQAMQCSLYAPTRFKAWILVPGAIGGCGITQCVCPSVQRSATLLFYAVCERLDFFNVWPGLAQLNCPFSDIVRLLDPLASGYVDRVRQHVVIAQDCTRVCQLSVSHSKSNALDEGG
ncbi:hypothetical protein K458DRAFT_56849 [Lentithecium fluviatile CBS 122367]|uniref:Uncharacterized protein n=1 Tax=Lentithecium fluviatile CBS 122367 TaxID=1168545 RepID=A0A6G1IY63_9PLEO|nr:hypothetical protein K458DRAFT_56849 [Lentithecium fluviatile CBS 122367]